MQSTSMFASSKSFNNMSFACYFLVWVMMVASSSHALTCFESNEEGDMIEVTNKEWTHCVLLPERFDNNNYVEGKAFGVGPENDMTETYQQVFSLNTQLYQVLSMCIYERFDFGKISPKFSFKQPEFMLRCFCNFDGCNREKNFFGYINNLKSDSAALGSKRGRIASEALEASSRR